MSSSRNRDIEITLGAEVETYTITLDDFHVGRHFMLPRKAVFERGESYHRDRTIGIEYASRPFHSIREAYFGIKGGLRKHMAKYRFAPEVSSREYVLFFAGTWRDRFAATHFHVGLGPEGMDFEHARRLSRHLHGHLPLLIALLANSPVYKERINCSHSNRLLQAGDKYFHPLEFGELDQEYREEMTFNLSRKKRIPTIEIRPCDANLPEYMAAGLLLVKAVTMAWLARRPVANHNSTKNHLKARQSAARRGPRARLFWNDRPLSAVEYLDRFFKEYRTYLSRMDVPAEVVEVLKLFKLGWNGAEILRRACLRHHRVHPRTWQKYFAQDYAGAVKPLLDGETVSTFARMMGLRPPPTSSVRLSGQKW